MKIGSLASDPKFSSDEEREYALFSVHRHEEEVVAKFLLLMSVFWVPFALIWASGIDHFFEIKTLCIYQFFVALISCFTHTSSINLQTKRKIVFALVALTQGVWCLTAVYGPLAGNWGRTLTGIWICLILFSNAFLPVRSYGHNFMYVFVIATSVLGLENYFERDLALIIIAVCLFLGQNYCIYTHRMIKMAAISRYQEQVRYVPKKVLFTAEKNNISVLDVFSPAPRYCVCICSDWRNFQKLTKSTSMEDLSTGLADYYQKLLEQIAQIIPDGNFFFDWIADELFLVIFSNDEKIDPKIAKEAMIASRRIIEFRYEFYLKFGFPSGVDVGVASGVASVGIFSSGAIVKATAFGKIPNEARALQEMAKCLRAKFSDSDRIVMTESFAQESEISKIECTKIVTADNGSFLSWPVISDHVIKKPEILDSRNGDRTIQKLFSANEPPSDAHVERM